MRSSCSGDSASMPRHSRLRLVQPMLRLSEYSSGLHRSAQGPNPDEIVTKVPKIHPMVEMLTALSQGDVVFGVTNGSDEKGSRLVPTLSTVAETSAPSVPTQSEPCCLTQPEGWGGSSRGRRLCVRGPAAACG